ncbi:unnamed protein product [Polarella glacialis]|uniref:Arsenical-resistance protein n=1 Tax=Polarella glacialis TaxID=89957 RepID=A0A813KMU5_POLGL|nr:unnamed protein product [Polarella glacialis]
MAANTGTMCLTEPQIPATNIGQPQQPDDMEPIEAQVANELGQEKQQDAPNEPEIAFFERYLSVWVLLCMIVGGLIGYYAPQVADVLAKAEFAQINGVVAALLWIMIFPMLVQIDFTSIVAVRKTPGAIILTSAVNFLVAPFTMYGLAQLFFRSFYTSVIPDEELRDSYIAGLIILAGAPCTAMVFVWSTLMGGDGAYTLVQVVFNDLLMLFLYVPTAVLLIGASNIALPWETIILAVVLFLVVPLMISAGIRSVVVRNYGEKFLQDRVVAPCAPLTKAGLLAMLVLIFIFQGKQIGNKPLDIVLLAVPIVIQVVVTFGITYVFGYFTCMPHSRLGPAALIATSNFFELAVAVAISAYGVDSGAALATVVGVLVEVPVMLALVKFCNRMKPRLDAKCTGCDVNCARSRDMGELLVAKLSPEGPVRQRQQHQQGEA